MRRGDLEKLLGGYAAGTLTAEERRALFEAALTDQALFEALADEEPLRDALADPGARALVAAALRDEPRPFWERLAVGLRLHRSRVFAAVGGLAAVAVVVGAIAVGTGTWRKPVAEKQEIAMLRTPAPPAPAEVAPEVSTTIDRPPLPQAKPVQAPRQLLPPPSLALKKEKTVTAESPAPALDAASARAAGGVVGGVIGGVPAAAPPPPPPPPVAAPAPGARTLFYEAEGKGAERDRAQRADARLRTLNAPARQAGDLGLRYSLVRRGPDGRDVDVPLDTVLERGEAARLRIEVNQAAHLSVRTDGAALFAGDVAAGRSTFVDARPGKIRIVVMRRAEAAGGVAGFLSGPQDAGAGQPVAAEAANDSVYVVNTGTSPNPRVAVEIELKYR